MGMFDRIRCKYPLPRSEMAEWEFQTKDLLDNLDNYEIRENGSLWKDVWDDCDEPPYHTNHRWIGIDFTGVVHFYDYRDNEDTKWWEFQATFKDGQLINMLQIKPAPEME